MAKIDWKNSNIFELLQQQIKGYNSVYNLKDICIANQAAPVGVLNDVYYYTGDVTATVFGIAGVTKNSLLWHNGTSWETAGVILDLSQKANVSEMTKYSLFMLPEFNYINSESIIDGAYRHVNTGLIIPSVGHFHDTFLYKVVPGKIFVIEGVQQQQPTSVGQITFYNRNKERIRSISTITQAVFEFTPLEGEYFVSFSGGSVNINNYKFYPKTKVSYNDLNQVDEIQGEVFQFKPTFEDAKTQLRKQTVYIPNFIHSDGYGIWNINEGSFSKGDLVKCGGDSQATDFIDITDFISIIIKLATRSASIASIAFYNSSKEYIEGYSYLWNEAQHIFTNENKPLGAKYIKLSRDTFFSSTNTCTITYNFALSDRVSALENKILDSSSEDECLAACGDSITNANHDGIEDIQEDDLYLPFDGYPDLNTYKRKCYAYFIAKKNGLKWANYGYGGTTLIDCTFNGVSTYGFSAANGRYTKLKAGINFKYITIFFGWNDSHWGVLQQKEIWIQQTYGAGLYYPHDSAKIGTPGFATQAQFDACNAVTGIVGGIQYNTADEYFRAKFIGTIDSTDNKTWYGAWNTVLPYLMLKYPTSKILIIVPYNRADNDGPSTKQRDACIEIANKWGLPYYDFRESCKFMEANITPITGYADLQRFRFAYLSADTLHPSQAGYEYMFPSINAKLMSI